MNKKKVFTLALAVCLIAILSMGSLAWFSDADSVINDFYVGGEGNDPDAIFSLDVYESVDVDGDGVIDQTIGYRDDGSTGWEYENVVPGDKLWKKIYAENTGMYDQWVRFKVTIDNASKWSALETKYGFKLHDLLLATDGTKLTESTDWTFAVNEIVLDETADTVTYVFYYNKVLSAEDSWIYLFQYVQIPEAFNQYDMALFAGGQFQLVAVGEAVQVDNINANNAIDAFAIVSGAKENG